MGRSRTSRWWHERESRLDPKPEYGELVVGLKLKLRGVENWFERLKYLPYLLHIGYLETPRCLYLPFSMSHPL